MIKQLWEMDQVGKRYEDFLSRYRTFLVELGGLIKLNNVTSLVGEEDRRGFRFRYLGQSFILRFDYLQESTLTLYAIDHIDDDKIEVRRQFKVDRHGEVIIPESTESLSLTDADKILATLMNPQASRKC